MSEGFTFEIFSAEVGTRFQMAYGDAHIADLELISANDLSTGPRHIQFSLVFLGPEHCPLEQKIYQLKHDNLGTLDVFLVPVGKTDKGIEYEAIFNRNTN
ncbi:MAG TPA: hypothetical protein VI756_20630 [Blastocatellia bacterium]